jgi:hypothetical protein
MNNLTTLILVAILLAALAHLKIYLLQNSINNVITVISDRFKVIDAKVGQIEALNVQPDQLPEALAPVTNVSSGPITGPAGLPMNRNVEVPNRPYAMVLQTFYGLSKEARARVFDDVAKQIHGPLFESVYKACMSEGRSFQVASDLQEALVGIPDDAFEAIKASVMNHSERPKADVTKPVDVADVANLTEPTLESIKVPEVSEPPAPPPPTPEVKPKPKKITRRKGKDDNSEAGTLVA